MKNIQHTQVAPKTGGSCSMPFLISRKPGKAKIKMLDTFFFPRNLTFLPYKRIKSIFKNDIATDGNGVDIFFARAAPSETSLPSLDIKDFSTEDLQNKFHLSAADPGVTEVFATVDGHQDDSHEIRKMSTREYYHSAGYDRTNHKILSARREKGIEQIESRCPTKATSSSTACEHYIFYLDQHLEKLAAFYGKITPRLRF